MSRYGLRGALVGEASHPGPSRRSSQRPVEGRDVVRRCSRSVEVEATKVDSDSDDFPSKSFTCVQQRKRRKATRVHSDSEASAQFARGRFAPLSSDSEDEFNDFSAGADRIEVVARRATCQVVGRRASPVGVDSPASPPLDVDGLEQDLCHPPPEMYAMSEGEECPPTARDGVLGDGETGQRSRRLVLVSGNAEVVPMSCENDHREEDEEVLGEGASEGEPTRDHTGSVRVVGSGGLEVVVHSESQSDEECVMFGGAVQERIACAIGRSVWRSREPSSIGEGMETLPIAAEDVVASPPERWVDLKVQVDRTIRQICPGEWVQLILASVQCDEQAAVIRRRKGRRGDDLEHRAIRALNFVQVGELSSARQALEGAEVAPGTEDTLKELSDTSKRLDRLLDPIPQEVMEHVPAMPFTLDHTSS